MKTKTFLKALALFVMLVAASAGASAQGCLSYEPSAVELTGTLSRKVMPGPPNYESVRKGDAPETIWVLRLTRPVCVEGNTTDVNTPERAVSDLQLVLDEQQYAQARRLVGRGVRVLAKGKLFHAHTAHHRTSVLLAVDEIVRSNR